MAIKDVEIHYRDGRQHKTWNTTKYQITSVKFKNGVLYLESPSAPIILPLDQIHYVKLNA